MAKTATPSARVAAKNPTPSAPVAANTPAPSAAVAAKNPAPSAPVAANTQTRAARVAANASVARTEPPRTREAPARPSTVSPNAPPVIVKVPPPFSVRMSQLFWVVSFAVGGFTAVYFFVVRQDLLPLIADRVRAVAEGRPDETYDTAADIVFWVVFGLVVAMILFQITLLVSFMSRKPRVRWWQLATFAVQVMTLLLSWEWVAMGERGKTLPLLLAAQAGLVLIALICSVMPNAIAWTARRHDVRRGHEDVIGRSDL